MTEAIGDAVTDDDGSSTESKVDVTEAMGDAATNDGGSPTESKVEVTEAIGAAATDDDGSSAESKVEVTEAQKDFFGAASTVSTTDNDPQEIGNSNPATTIDARRSGNGTAPKTDDVGEDDTKE